MKNITFTDAGRSKSKRPKQKNDCSVRAAAIAFNINYDDCYNVMAENGRKCNDGMLSYNYKKAINQISKEYNKFIIKYSFIGVKGQKRLSTLEFIEKFPKGNFILGQAEHFVGVSDGVIKDDITTWDKIVYSAWEIKDL